MKSGYRAQPYVLSDRDGSMLGAAGILHFGCLHEVMPDIPSAMDPRPHLALETITHLEIVILNFLEKGCSGTFFCAKLSENEAAVSCFTATFHSWSWPCCCYFAAWMLASPMTWILSRWRCMGAPRWHTDAWILNSESILSLLGTLDLLGF